MAKKYSWKAFLPFTPEGKRMRKDRPKKEKKRFSFQRHLKKAGLEHMEEAAIKRTIFKSAIYLSLLVSIYVIVSAVRAEKSAWDVLVFLAGYWTAAFVGVLILLTLGFVLYLDFRAWRLNRTARKEEKREEKRERKIEKEKYSWKSFFPFTEEGKALREERKENARKKPKRKFSLEDHLRKAGYDLDEKTVKRRIFKTSVIIALVISLLIILSATRAYKGVGSLLVFMSGYWTAFFVLILIVVAFAFSLYLDVRAYRRTKEVEHYLPDYLQLASANISAGMPLDKALWFAVRPNFGVLAREIEMAAKSTYAGKELREALMEFASKFDSKILDRSISLLLEGMEAGGEMAELLSKISMNIEETEILKKEMSASVTTYVIFIGMATLFGAPFLFGLATQLLIIIQQIAGNLGSTGTGAGGMFSFQINANVVKVSDFKLYSSLMLAVTSFFSGAIISVIRKGDIKEGAILIPFFIIFTLILYYLANLALGGMMGAFL